jgi:plasmid maintenance system antidote protein VapI
MKGNFMKGDGRDIKCRSESDRQAREFQRGFIIKAIDKFGSQEKLARALCVTQQTVSKYKDGSNVLALSRIIRIAKMMGEQNVNVGWN